MKDGSPTTTSSDELREAAHKAMDAYLNAGGTSDFVIVSRADLSRNCHCEQASDGLLGNNSSDNDGLGSII